MTFALAAQHPHACTPELLAVYARAVYEGGDPDDAPFKACYVQYLLKADRFSSDYAPQTLCGERYYGRLQLLGPQVDLCGVTNCEACLAYVFQVERRRRGVGCWVTVDKDVNSYLVDAEDDPIARARWAAQAEQYGEYDSRPVRLQEMRTDRVTTQQMILGYTRSVRTVRHDYRHGRLDVLSTTTCADPSLAVAQIALLLADRRTPVVRPLIVA